MSTRFSWITSSLLLSTVIGCGGGGPGDAPELEPVTGTVTMDGSPAVGVSVQFLGEGTDTKGSVSSAVTDEAGNFTLKNASGIEGCAAGTYIVRFSKFAMPDGSAIPEGSDPITAGAEEVIPSKYNNPNEITDSVDVPAGGKAFTFTIETK